MPKPRKPLLPPMPADLGASRPSPTLTIGERFIDEQTDEGPCERCIRLLRTLLHAQDELHRVGGCEGGLFDESIELPHSDVCREITKARGQGEPW